MNPRFAVLLIWFGCSLALLAACAQKEQPEAEARTVHNYLEGRFTVSADVDSVPDYRGFEVLVTVSSEGEPDTLGYGVTDSTGAFQLDVEAPARGIYALIVSRRGQILKVDELAVADSDSVSVQATFPVGNRLLRLRSPENAAWLAYRNTKAQYNNTLLELLRNDRYTHEAVGMHLEQAAAIFWNMRTMFPNTMGSEVAAAEAVMMLGGWNDSLALARASEISPDNLSYAGIGRVARQAQARLAGQDAALQQVRDFQARAVDDEQRAQLQSELVLAYMDSLQHDEALAAARVLRETYADTKWAAWGDRAIYELENLLPGMAAPSFTATTREGSAVVLDSLRGSLVLLEFYTPQDQTFQREFAARNALYEAAGDAALRIVSISVEPDTLLNEAFLEGRNVPGLHIFAPGSLGGELAQRYNINVIPTRFLIDSEGKIVGKYVGAAIAAVQADVLSVLGNS